MNEAMKQHGAFSWNELSTSNVTDAKRFYGELLGWTLEPYPGAVDYTMAKADNKELAGMMVTPEDAGNMPPMWMPYITVDDVDSTATRVESLGGKVCAAPQDLPKVGRFAVIQDPQGAMFSIITYVAEA